jgi:hypothetical protein
MRNRTLLGPYVGLRPGPYAIPGGVDLSYERDTLAHLSPPWVNERKELDRRADPTQVSSSGVLEVLYVLNAPNIGEPIDLWQKESGQYSESGQGQNHFRCPLKGGGGACLSICRHGHLTHTRETRPFDANEGNETTRAL